MANELQNKNPADTYKDLLHLGTATTSSAGDGLPAVTPHTVYDGDGNASKLKLSQASISADNITITNGTISSLSTPLALSDGGTGGGTAATVKALWSIDKVENIKLTTWDGGTDESGSAITPPITKVGTITTGTWNGTIIDPAKGGTGTTSLVALKSALSLDLAENIAVSTWAGSSNISTVGTIGAGVWSGTVIALNKGGTGASTATAARTNLGLGSIATQNTTNITATGGNLSNINIDSATISNSSISSMSSLTVGSTNISGTTIQHATNPTNHLTIPFIVNTETITGKCNLGSLIVTRTSSSDAGAPAISIRQYSNETNNLIAVGDQYANSKATLTSTGQLKANQLDGERFIDFRSTQAVSLGGQYSVFSADKTVIESHDSKFTGSNIAVGDLVRIKQTAGGSWEIREVISITDNQHIVVAQAFTNTYTNTTLFEKHTSASSRKFSIENDGSIGCGCPTGGGAWDTGHLRLGPYHIWVDSTGDLRIKNGAPTSAADGSVVGTQS